MGVFDFAQQNGIQIIKGPVESIEVPVTGGKVFKTIQIPRMLHNAKIINLPKLKTHVSAKMTCGMKNLIGLLPDSEKRRVHVRGVHESIVDLGKVFQPVLTVVDATTCMEGDGPTYGDKIDLNLIVSGKDPLAIDKICCQLIGISWQEVRYLRLANDTSQQHDVEIAGESLENLHAHFKIPRKTAFYHLSTRMIHMIDTAFSKVFSQHFNQFLFSTGYFGTNPKIIEEKCDGCGECVSACPIENVINIEARKVYYNRCIRCLDCFFVSTCTLGISIELC